MTAAFQPEHAGEQAIEPGALLRRERRGLCGRKDGIGGRGVMLMRRPPLCAIALSASMSWRRAKPMKLSWLGSAMREIGFEDALDVLRRGLRFDVAVKFAAERGVRAEATADQHVIALDRVALLVFLNRTVEQADLGREMLRAGMMATGEMDVDRRIEREPRIAPERDLLGMALGVGGGELAAGIAGAGDEAGADGVASIEPERFDPLLRGLELRSGRPKSAGSARR